MNDDLSDLGAPSDDIWQPVRAGLRDVAVPAEARESALAAALGAFDELYGAPVAATAAAAGTVVSLEARRGSRWTRWVGAAAAAVAVLAIGGVVITGLQGGDDEVAVEPAARTAAEATAADPAAAAGTEAGGGDAGQVGDDTLAPAAAETTAPTIASIDVAAVPETLSAPETTAPGSTAEPTESVADPDDLATYAARTMAAPPIAGVPDSSCVTSPGQEIGVVSYQGVTAIVVNNGDGSYSAIDADTCAVLATVRI